MHCIASWCPLVSTSRLIMPHYFVDFHITEYLLTIICTTICRLPCSDACLRITLSVISMGDRRGDSHHLKRARPGCLALAAVAQPSPPFFLPLGSSPKLVLPVVFPIEWSSLQSDFVLLGDRSMCVGPGSMEDAAAWHGLPTPGKLRLLAIVLPWRWWWRCCWPWHGWCWLCW